MNQFAFPWEVRFVSRRSATESERRACIEEHRPSVASATYSLVLQLRILTNGGEGKGRRGLQKLEHDPFAPLCAFPEARYSPSRSIMETWP